MTFSFEVLPCGRFACNEIPPTSTLFPPVSCAATVETQFLFLEELSSCFYCVNDFACVSPMLSLTKDTDWVSLFLIIPMLLSFRLYISTVSWGIIYFVSFQPLPKVVYQGLHIPVLPIFVGSHNIGSHFRYFVESGQHESPKHVAFAHCQQRIVISAHALVKFLDLQVIGSFDDRKGHYFFYVCVHNKFALAILGFQSFPGYLLANFIRLQVCDLCSYVWIDHFQQIAEFLRCADRFVVDLCDKHLLESNPVAGRSFERCYYQFGQFCCGSTGFFLQFQAFMRRL